MINHSKDMRRMRVATYNCQTLNGKFIQLLAWIHSRNIDLIALEETRLSPDSFGVFETLCTSYGYQVYPSCTAVDSSGVVTGGMAFVSRWPLKTCALDGTGMHESEEADTGTLKPREF